MIGLTEDLGQSVTQRTDASRRTSALRRAALLPAPFGPVLRAYDNKKLPSEEMLPKILTTQYGRSDGGSRGVRTADRGEWPFRRGDSRDRRPHVLLDDITGASAPIDQQAHSADDPQLNEPSAPPTSPTLPMPFPSVPVAALCYRGTESQADFHWARQEYSFGLVKVMPA